MSLHSIFASAKAVASSETQFAAFAGAKTIEKTQEPQTDKKPTHTSKSSNAQRITEKTKRGQLSAWARV